MSETAKPKRRFQFRLRTLLVAILVLSLPLSWFAVRLKKAGRQRIVTAEIEHLGGYIVYDWEYAQQPKPYPAWLRGVLGDDFFDTVAAVDFPHYLDNSMPDIQDADLAVLSDLGKLQHVSIGSTQVTDEGLEYLYGLRQLESLYLTKDPGVTTEGVMKLKEALPNCHIVSDMPIADRSK